MLVTQTLNESLGTLPSGRIANLSDDDVTRRLRLDYIGNKADQTRKRESLMRLDLYRDRGRPHFEAVIGDVFKNDKVRDWRKVFVKYAEFQNITKRIVREISTVYSEPARRTVSRPTNKSYQQIQHDVRMDRRMRSANRLGNLLNNVLVWPTVSMGVPRIRVITPDKFSAIAHPNDPAQLIGLIIEQFPDQHAAPTSSHYIVLDGQSFFNLDKDGRMIKDSRRPHGMPYMPVLLFSRDESEESLLDQTSGRDIISAHLAIALLNTMMLKHQKSGTKQPYASGDLETTALNQAMDEENLLQLGEGVTLSTLDLGADPNNYIAATRSIIKQIAANHGIPESVFDLSYQATSGFEIELKRVGLREVRRDQILDYRPFERDLATIQAAVLEAAGHPLAFDSAKWSIDFGEVETPKDPIQRIAYWEKLEGMDLANRVEMYMEMNPESTEEEAAAAIDANAMMRVKRTQQFQQQVPTAFSGKDGNNPPTDRDGNKLKVVKDEPEDEAANG